MRQAIVIAGILAASFLPAQQSGAPLQFEVASIKPMPADAPYNTTSKTGGPGTADPGQITWTGATLQWLLYTAYDVRSYQISGPSWLNAERYTIVAKVPQGATKRQVNVMWLNLLQTRFGVVVHHESKVFESDAIMLARGALKLKETGSYGPDELLDRYMTSPGLQVAGDGPNRHLLGRAQTIEEVARLLDSAAGHPVIDKTGLTGKYDFDVEYDLSPPADAVATFAPCQNCVIQAALQQDLGLKFVKSTVTLDVIVVDHAEKTPVEN